MKKLLFLSYVPFLLTSFIKYPPNSDIIQKELTTTKNNLVFSSMENKIDVVSIIKTFNVYNVDIIDAIHYTEKYVDYYDNPIDIKIFLSLVYTESRFNRYAINDRNSNGSIDYGICQLNNRTFPNMDIDEFFDIETNIKHSIEYIKFLKEWLRANVEFVNDYNIEYYTLASYNCGIGAVQKNRIPKSTKKYIKKIMKLKNEIK